MFFSVARPRLSIASAFLILVSSVLAHEETLFTSSVSYCAPPESLLIQQFDVAYIAANSSVTFNVSAASVLPNINVTANLLLNVYGMQPVNISIDLCSVFNGALCPLPTYNFVGSDSITLPSSVNIASLLPAIAYKIPDLEAFAQLTLTEVGTGRTTACVQSTVSNGWSTHQTAVEWSTGGMTLLALFSAIWQSYMPESLAPIRLLDVIYLFQTIAVSGLLSLNYPSVYRAFTSNFSWALGLFPTSSSSHLQNSINRMRHLTGGGLANATDDTISLVNRKLSPYNVPHASYVVPQSLLTRVAALPTVDLKSLLARDTLRNATDAVNNSNLLVGGNVATVTAGSSNVLQAGIPIYVNFIGVATANTFMTIFLTVLISLVVLLAALGLGYLLLLAVGYTSGGRRRQSRLKDAQAAYPAWARAWGLRVVLAAIFPILIFTFYQWTLKDSWLSILLSVILLLALIGLGVFTFLALRPAFSRASTSTPSPSFAPLTAPFLSHRVYFLIPVFLAILVKSLVIAFAQSHGLVQAVVLLVVEVLLFGVLLVMRPHRTRGADVFAGFLSIIRIVCTGLLVAFAESINLKPIPRVVIGIITAVIFSVTVIVMFLNILVNAGLWRLLKHGVCWGPRRMGFQGAKSLSSKNSADSSSLENGEAKHDAEKDDTVMPAQSSFFRQRPQNPSPTHTPATSPPVTPMSLSLTSEPHSTYSQATTSTTLGETLPRRWSFEHSRPPSTGTYTPSAGLTPVTPVSSGPMSTHNTSRHSRRPSSPTADYSDR